MLLPVKGDPPRYIYIPAPRAPPPPPWTYRLATEINRAAERRLAQERRQREFLRDHPRYQPMCRCGHRQFAHRNGDGPCEAKKCDCTEFREIG